MTGEQCVCAEYVTREGLQTFERFDWMNGETVTYVIPEGVQRERAQWWGDEINEIAEALRWAR